MKGATPEKEGAIPPRQEVSDLLGAYLADPDSCPRCHEATLVWSSWEVQGTVVRQAAWCESCDLEFQAVYILSGIVPVED